MNSAPDRDLIRLHNLRRRLWDRIKAGAEHDEVRRLIEELNDATDRALAKKGEA